MDRSRIVYNDEITLAGIPDEAHDYLIGSQSAIGDRMDSRALPGEEDKASGIVNDPNDWGLEHTVIPVTSSSCLRAS